MPVALKEQLTDQFITYDTKDDPSNTDSRYLVAGSKNVLINDDEKVSSREGYTLAGPAGTTGNPIVASTEWENSSGSEIVLRAHDAVLEVLVNGNYEDLMSGLTSVSLIFDAFWDDTNKIDQLIWTDGTITFRTWSGAIGNLSSITATRLKLSGSNTFGESRFLISDFSHSLMVKDDAGVWHPSTYQLGAIETAATISFVAASSSILDSSNGFIINNFNPGDTVVVSGSASNNGTYTITSVTAGAMVVVPALGTAPITNENAGASDTLTVTDSLWVKMGGDLTGSSFTTDNLIMQVPDTYTNVAATGFIMDFVRVINNQAWIGSRSSNVVYVSKTTSISDFSFSTPRAPGEGAQLTLDGPGRAIESLKSDVILHAGTDFIYKSNFTQITVGTTLAETLDVILLKTTSRQAAIHQNLICNIGNGLVWIGADNQLYELTDATLAYNPNLETVSDPIKPDFLVANFTGGHMKFDKTRVYISAPLSSTNFIYEFRLNPKLEREYFWQPPQSWPVQRWATIGGLIHGHSLSTNETYKLFDGFNDNGEAIHCVALLSKWDGAYRMALKALSEMFNEGGISANTILMVSYLFEKDGGDIELITKTISGSNTSFLYSSSQDPSLGNNPYGDDSLSGDVILTTLALPHFRIIHEINPEEFFNYDVKFETNDVDAQWAILAHGNNAELSTGIPTGIKN